MWSGLVDSQLKTSTKQVNQYKLAVMKWQARLFLITLLPPAVLSGCYMVSDGAKDGVEKYANSYMGKSANVAFAHFAKTCVGADGDSDCLWLRDEAPSQAWARHKLYNWARCGREFGERGCLHVTAHVFGCKLWFPVDRSNVVSAWRYVGDPEPCWRMQGLG